MDNRSLSDAGKSVGAMKVDGIEITQKDVKAGALTWSYREAVAIGAEQGPPVVFLHGLVSQGYSWRGVMSALAKEGTRSLAPDWIGHGFSDKPDKREFDYSPESFVAAFGEWIDALELEQFVLVVQGYLGVVGLLYAAKNLERISRLAVVNAPVSGEAKLPFKISQMGLPLVGQMLTQDPILVDRTLEGSGPYAVDDADLDVYRKPFLTSSDAGRSLFTTIQKLQTPKVAKEIETRSKGWEVPTRVIWGMEDKWLPVSVGEAFARGMSDTKVVKLEKTGHYAQEDWAEKVAEVLVPFVRG